MDMAGHLVLSRELGEGVFIGDAHVKVARLSDSRVSLYITAPEEINIRRDEVPARTLKTHGAAKVQVMRSDRTLALVEADFMQKSGAMLFYTLASDGVYVPTCDLSQYEAGKRKPRFERTHCSQCGKDLGPGDCGTSHCDQHRIEEEEAEARNREFNYEDMAVEDRIAERKGL
jgi:carbon storage regulator CsrA